MTKYHKSHFRIESSLNEKVKEKAKDELKLNFTDLLHILLIKYVENETVITVEDLAR